jgi:hypothetical protein
MGEAGQKAAISVPGREESLQNLAKIFIISFTRFPE